MNKVLSTKISAGILGGALVLALAFVLLPSSASAYGYGYEYYSYPASNCCTNFNYIPVSVPEPVQIVVPVVSPVYYQVPTPVPVYYQPLSVTCSANVTSAPTGVYVKWTAYPTGGNRTYNYWYSWSGTDGLYSSNESASIVYTTPGQKFATVKVYLNNQTVVANCSNSVNVYPSIPIPVPVPVQIQIPVPTMINPGLDIGCYADPNKAGINQPVTWNAEVTGGLAPFTYSWTGTDNLSGNQSSAIKFYSTSGSKYALVSVTSADGKSGTRACSNSVTVSKPVTYVKPVPKPTPTCPTNCVAAVSSPTPTPTPSPSPTQQAVALFSLGNVPWGWVALLVILVLFATVLYLLFNRQKI